MPGQVGKLVTRAAPVGGLNARDALANMPEGDAVQLINWIPDNFGVRCRKGYREWAINFPADNEIQGLMSYFDAASQYPAGTYLTAPTTMPGQFFAATKAGIYEITTATDAPVADIALAGTSNSGWFSSVMLANSAGSFLLACSEDDGYFTYDGTTWLRRVAGAGAGEVNGVNPNNLVHVSIWKRRAWFVERNTANVWYLPVDSISGTIVKLDVGPLLRMGGSVAYTANWTIDAGEGIDDLFVIVSSNGEVLVYKGTDPSSASTFALVGTWDVGQVPVGRRAYCQFGGDLVIVSANGVYPISYVTRGGADVLQASNKEYSSKIRAAIGADLQRSFTSRGWDLLVHPSERLVVFGTPDTTNRSNFQYALSTSQNQWTSFTDVPAYTYGSTGGYAFAGTRDGRVLLLFSSYFDNVQYGESSGSGIYGVIQPSYSVFDAASLNKMFTMIRPVFLGSSKPGVSGQIAVNYRIARSDTFPAYSVGRVALWDVALWDQAYWSAQQQSYGDWMGVGGVGYAGTAVLQTATVGDTVLASIDYQYQVGGAL